MNKYLQEVWSHLGGIPKADAQELLEYYEEYFLDANLSLEEIVAKYGKPKKFTQALLMTYYLDQDDVAQKNEENSAKPRFRLVWMVTLALFASPILVPVAIAVVIVILAVFISILAILLGLFATAAGLIVAGLFSVVSGLGVMLQSLATMDLFVGLGILAIGLGLLLGLATVKLTRWFFILFINFVKWLGRKISRHQMKDSNHGKRGAY